jgi:hypothetical protein
LSGGEAAVRPPASGGRGDARILVLSALAIAGVYLSLFGVYRPNNLDDAWYGSYLYNWVHKGIPYDAMFGDGPEDGRWLSVRVFGKTQAFLYAPILDRLGWTKPAFHAVSIGLMLAVAATWRALLLRLRFSRPAAGTVALLLLVVEPFFGAANQARPDALVLALASLSAFLAARGWLVAAGLAAGTAMETHAMGITALAFVAAVRLAAPETPVSLRRLAGEALRFGLGLAPAALYYAVLHADALRGLPAMLAHGNASALPGDNALYQYFCATRYGRHLPELAFLSVALVLFVRMRAWRVNRFGAALLVSTALLLAVARRPNFMYAVYFFPAFLVAMVQVVEIRWGRPAWLLAGWLALLLPQYALAYRMNRGFDMAAHVAAVRRNMPAEGGVVFGGPNDWFALQERTFYATAYRGSLDRLDLRTFRVIEDDACRRGEYPKLAALLARCEVTEVASFTVNGRAFRILHARR